MVCGLLPVGRVLLAGFVERRGFSGVWVVAGGLGSFRRRWLSRLFGDFLPVGQEFFDPHIGEGVSQEFFYYCVGHGDYVGAELCGFY